MSRIRIYGDESGFIEIKAPDVAGNTTVEIPEGGFVGEQELDNAINEINNTISNLENETQQKLNEIEAIAILGL
jgi:hypothetical protein